MSGEAQSEAAPPQAIGPLSLEPGRLFFILGPCLLESEAFAWRMARALRDIAEALHIPFVFKASYDKANRTSVGSPRGPGPRDGCRILGEIARELAIPVTTDIHSPEEAETAAEHVDLLQIPAFLCRQTDLLAAAARTGRAVNVKKGQFLAPWDTVHIAEKLDFYGCRNWWITERGTTFGYGQLVADMRSLHWMRTHGIRAIFDATHSVQTPGSAAGVTGGDRELAPVLARAAVAAGCDGIFMETHENPETALSDGPNQVRLSTLPPVLQNLLAIHAAAHA